MARVSEKELSSVKRRISSVTNHLFPSNSGSNSVSVGLNNASAMSDSYHRIHGEVPSHDVVWRIVASDDESGKEFTDIIYEKADGEGIAKITINRPERRNAFRPQTTKELIRAFNDARDDSSVGVIILTGKGTKAFCSGGDQALRTKDGYADYEDFGRLNVLDLQVSYIYALEPSMCTDGSLRLNSRPKFGGNLLRLLQRPYKYHSCVQCNLNAIINCCPFMNFLFGLCNLNAFSTTYVSRPLFSLLNV
ncbi:hypothetical protein Dsin_010393 [Dipteronia sinensis]|uniref:Naphthoate synthase n=1 Tax=Dipteronia sinensis TaxID=43782 RepID=A0AAE0ASQ1_9ROSI|nr:hypothetical protein Dsin_010393 [Dipteronia sinensis]